MHKSSWDCRGFVKVLNRRATEFDTRAKNWQGLRALPPIGVRGHAPPEILKFYSRRDVFSCILKLYTMTFNNQKKGNFSRQFNHDLIPIPTTQVELFGSLLIALLI